MNPTETKFLDRNWTSTPVHGMSRIKTDRTYPDGTVIEVWIRGQTITDFGETFGLPIALEMTHDEKMRRTEALRLASKIKGQRGTLYQRLGTSLETIEAFAIVLGEIAKILEGE